MKWGIVLESETTGPSYLMLFHFLGCPSWGPLSTQSFKTALFRTRTGAVKYARQRGVYPHRREVRIVQIPDSQLAHL